jgi:hypothetical protein
MAVRSILFQSKFADKDYLGFDRLSQASNGLIKSFYLNLPYTFELNKHGIFLEQGDLSFCLSPNSNINFGFFPASFDDFSLILPFLSDSEYSLFELRQWYVAYNAICDALDQISTLNKPKSAARAANKIICFSLLTRFNLPIPKSIGSNSSRRVHKFSKETRLIYKQLSDTNRVNNNELFSPSFVDEVFLEELDSDDKLPFIYQEYIEYDNELRAFCIGDQVKVFCLNYENLEEVDPRFSNDCCKGVEITDSLIFETVRKVRKIFDLDYVCIDLLQAGEQLFIIDVNPHGTWYWIDSKSANEVEQLFHQFLESKLIR